jgi:hypothetical protein
LNATNEGAASGYGSGCRGGSVSQWYGSADPDPYQNVRNPQHLLMFWLFRKMGEPGASVLQPAGTARGGGAQSATPPSREGGRPYCQ